MTSPSSFYFDQVFQRTHPWPWMGTTLENTISALVRTRVRTSCQHEYIDDNQISQIVNSCLMDWWIDFYLKSDKLKDQSIVRRDEQFWSCYVSGLRGARIIRFPVVLGSPSIFPSSSYKHSPFISSFFDVSDIVSLVVRSSIEILPLSIILADALYDPSSSCRLFI